MDSDKEIMFTLPPPTNILLYILLHRLSYQTDGCTFEEESEETFNEQEAG